MERRPPPPDRPPLSEADIERLQALLDAVPAPLEPLDASMIDGYLCGVLLQPRPVAEAQWMPPALDARDDEEDATTPRPLPAGFDAAPLTSLLRRRHAELERAIARREWFDPWVFEPDPEGTAGEDDDEVQAVQPWVAGFAFAMARFPGLMTLEDAALLEPLALVLRHLDPAELEDADALLAEIDTLEPPADLAEAVEDLVRATLLLADVSRPRASPPPRRGRHRKPAR